MSRPTECTMTQMNPNVNHGFAVIMMCQVRLINLTNIILWWEILVAAEAVHGWGQGVYGKSLLFA